MGLTIDYRFGWLFHNHVGTDLTGFTSTRIPFGAVDGSLTESSNLTWDGTTLDVHGYNCAAAIFRSNNYQNATGTRSITHSTVSDSWLVSNNLDVTGNLDISGSSIFNSSYGDNDVIINRQTSGQAYKYDCSNNTHTYTCGQFVINNLPSTGDAQMKITADTTGAAYVIMTSQNNQYYGLRMRYSGTYLWNLGNFGATANSFSLVDQVDSSRAIMTALSNSREIQWRAAQKFNMSFEDLDFIINKNTSGTAYQYDAGLDRHIFKGLSSSSNTIQFEGGANGSGENCFLNIQNARMLVGYLGTSSAGYLRAGGGKRLYIGSNGAIQCEFLIDGSETQFGTPGTNYTAVEADGTLEFNGDATVWNDIQFNIQTGRTAASNFPDWDATFTTNTGCYKFDVNDYIDLGSNELPHDWQEGSLVYPHTHIALDGANSSGSSQWVKFIVYIAYADAGEVFTETSKTIEIEIPTGSANLLHFLGQSTSLDLTGFKIGAQLNLRLKRIAATSGTEYPNHVFVTQTGIHYVADTVGSRSIATK